MRLSDQAVVGLIPQLEQCSPRERGALVRGLAEKMGVTVQTVYRRLKKHGWSSKRNARKDRGDTALTAVERKALTRLMAAGRNKRGQPNVPLKEALRIAQEQGLVRSSLSYGHVARILSQTGLSMRHMRAPEASVSRVSTHPNHVWFFDISVAIQWYFRDEDGRKLGQYTDAGARFYEGKRHNLAKVRRVIHRFAIVDHASAAYYVQYYYSAGETAVDVVDFFYRAMASKAVGNAAFPFRGVPRRLVLDQGSANKSALVRELLKGLDVEVEYHAPGNAKASGAVESRHNHWQRNFEGRLALRPAKDLEELNAWAEKSCALANGDRKHSRHRQTPLASWSRITADQLVECPDRETFFALATTKPNTGVLDARHWLRAKGRTWLIEGPHVHGKQKVSYRLAPFQDTGIRVWDEHNRELAATELSFDSFGFPENGRRHVWDSEDARGATAPPTPAQDIAAAVEETPVRVETMFDDLDARLQRQAYLAPTGRDWSPTTATAAAPVLSSFDAREEVARRLGRPLGSLPRSARTWWRDRIGDGLTAAELDAALAEFNRGLEVAQTA